MKDIIKTTCLASLISLAASISQASVTVEFSDDFGSYSTGDLPKQDAKWRDSNNSSGGTSVVAVDIGNVFGSGTGNQYLVLAQTGTASANIASQPITLSNTGMISFDFATPTAGQSSTLTFRIGTGNSNAMTAFSINLGTGSAVGQRVTTSDGSTILYNGSTPGTSTHVTIFYNNNNDGSVFSYNEGAFSGSVAANSMDVYVGNNLVGDNLVRSGSLEKGTALTAINFLGANGAKTLEVWLDNISVQSVSSIPEPSSFAIIGGLGVLFLYALRRRSR
ncbi:MAG: PEP-CTERM sorting domain-containing protein [Opitutaceae bacterium]|jgi:hypothetical protein|nr:PEP-CTERM sorting domain-containing protein [Opitutaceae bacterium]